MIILVIQISAITFELLDADPGDQNHPQNCTADWYNRIRQHISDGKVTEAHIMPAAYLVTADWSSQNKVNA